MFVLPPEISAPEVLTTFHRDAPYLFLGAAFVAVGLVSAAFAALRRKPDSLLIYFALFAIFYGSRLWIQAGLMQLTVADPAFYARLHSVIDFIVPIPAMLFFNAAGLLDRMARIVALALVAASACLAVATIITGPSATYHLINNYVVVATLLVLTALLIVSPRKGRDFYIVRRGLLVFVAGALFDNLKGVFNSNFPQVEAFGFAVFLGSLGYVAASRALERDHQLNEIQKELEIAQRIQLSILPGKFPESANFCVAARYDPMTSVAGDFYDFIVANDTQAGLLIADVSGHGVPAALIASMVKLAATAQRANAADPSKLLSEMNTALCGNTQNQFVTAAYVHLDSQAGELRYSAAAHPPMLLLRGGEVIEIVENGLMLGAFDFAEYSSISRRLERGDRLLLYTDGIIEAANSAGDFYGQESLSALLRDTAGTSPSSVVNKIVESVKQWSSNQDDDLTVLVCDYTGAAANIA